MWILVQNILSRLLLLFLQLSNVAADACETMGARNASPRFQSHQMVACLLRSFSAGVLQ